MLLVRALLFVWEMFSRVGSFINSFPHWLSDSLTQWLTDIALEFTYPMRHGKDWRMLKCRWSDAPSNWSAPIGNFLSLNLSLEVYFFYIWLSPSLSRNESIWSYGKIRLRRRFRSRHTQNNRWWFVSDEAWELPSCTKEWNLREASELASELASQCGI